MLNLAAQSSEGQYRQLLGLVNAAATGDVGKSVSSAQNAGRLDP